MMPMIKNAMSSYPCELMKFDEPDSKSEELFEKDNLSNWEADWIHSIRTKNASLWVLGQRSQVHCRLLLCHYEWSHLSNNCCWSCSEEMNWSFSALTAAPSFEETLSPFMSSLLAAEVVAFNPLAMLSHCMARLSRHAIDTPCPVLSYRRAIGEEICSMHSNHLGQGLKWSFTEVLVQICGFCINVYWICFTKTIEQQSHLQQPSSLEKLYGGKFQTSVVKFTIILLKVTKRFNPVQDQLVNVNNIDIFTCCLVLDTHLLRDVTSCCVSPKRAMLLSATSTAFSISSICSKAEQVSEIQACLF